MPCQHLFIFWSFGVEKCVHCAETKKRYGVTRVSPNRQRRPRKTCPECGMKVRGVNHEAHCRKRVD